MKLLDVLNAPWAIEPAKLLEIQGIYATHLRGEKIDIAGVEQRLGHKLDNQPKPYEIIDGVAVLPIEGVMAKRANLFMQISGGVSTQLIARDLRAALDDASVHSIILAIDSPGGTVDGTQHLANLVRQAGEDKPVVALASGTMASAAYWVGSAAGAVYIADGTTAVGSIGVVASHVDISKAEEARGVKTTEIVAGKFKRIASQYGPLTEAGRESIQEQVDYTYSLFVDAVAANRGVTAEKVLQDMADGRVFIGEQAIAAGLVDGVSTLEALVAQLNTNRAGVAPAIHQSISTKEPAMSLTREKLQAEAPELLQSLLAEGASAERARIQAVEGQLIPGHEALINTLKFDGKSSAGDAALAINAAERAARTAAAAALAADAPTPAPIVPAAPVAPVVSDEDASPEAVESKAKAAWDKDANVRAEFGNFGTYLAYARATAAGRVRTLSKANQE